MKKDYTKIVIAAALGIFLVFVLAQIVKFSGRMQDARAEHDAVKEDFERISAEKNKLQEEFVFYSDPENLSKEIRSRFNYTLPGEKLLILIQEDLSGDSE